MGHASIMPLQSPKAKAEPMDSRTDSVCLRDCGQPNPLVSFSGCLNDKEIRFEHVLEFSPGAANGIRLDDRLKLTMRNKYVLWSSSQMIWYGQDNGQSD